MSAYVQSGWNIVDHVQILLCLICMAMWADVASSPPALPEIRKKVLTTGFTDETLTDSEILQMAIVAQKFSSYLLVTSVHMFVLILKASPHTSVLAMPWRFQLQQQPLLCSSFR
jgi:hypothetical protein